MKTYILKPGRQIIGRAGDMNETAVAVNIAKWVEDYPAGIPQMMVTTPGGERVPLTVTVEDGLMVAVLPDTVTVGPGLYVYTAVMTNGPTQVQTARFECIVLGSELAKTWKPLGPRVPDWAERIFVAADVIERAMDGALEARTTAVDAAASAEASAEAAAASEGAAAASENAAELSAQSSAARAREASDILDNVIDQGAAQVTAIQAEGAAQVTAIREAGTAARESVPETYTQLSDDVSDLKSAIGWTNSGLVQQIGGYGGNILPYVGYVPGYISTYGDISSAGETTKEITFGYVPVTPGQVVKYHWRMKGSPWVAVGYWDDQKVFLSRATLSNGTHDGDYYYNTNEFTVPAGAYFFRFSMRTYGDYEAAIIFHDDIVSYVDAMTYGNLYVESASVAGYINTSGTISAASGAHERTSDYIAVSEGDVLTIQNWATVSSTDKLWIAYGTYDSSKAFINRVAEEKTAGVGYGLKTITTPQGCAYIRVTCRLYNDGKISITKGNVAFPYQKSAEDYALKSSVDAITESEDAISEALANGNLFVMSDATPGYIDTSGGIAAQTANNEFASDYIPVTQGKKYKIKVLATVGESQRLLTQIASYNSSKGFITRVGKEYEAGVKESEYVYTVPSGVSYIRVVNRLYGDGRVMIALGETDMAYSIAWQDIATKYSGDESTKGLMNPLIRTAAPRLAMHRGDMANAPENTIPAFELAGQHAGVWAIETDVYETSDGYFVCSHDNDVSLMTDGTGNITGMTYAQTQDCTIDAGANVDQYPNLKMPLFSDFLKVCRRYGKVALPEIKGIAHIDNFIAEIKKYGMEGSCILQMYYNVANPNVIRTLTYMPIQILTMANTMPAADLITLAKKYNDVWVSFPDSFVIKENLENAHSKNLPVSGWTYTSKSDVISAVDLGLDIAIVQGFHDLN